jgi:hypothetical protein
MRPGDLDYLAADMSPYPPGPPQLRDVPLLRDVRLSREIRLLRDVRLSREILVRAGGRAHEAAAR